MNKFTVGIMKSAKKIEQLFGRVIPASGGTAILFSVLLRYLLSMGLWLKGTDLGLVTIQNFYICLVPNGAKGLNFIINFKAEGMGAVFIIFYWVQAP